MHSSLRVPKHGRVAVVVPFFSLLLGSVVVPFGAYPWDQMSLREEAWEVEQAKAEEDKTQTTFVLILPIDRASTKSHRSLHVFSIILLGRLS